MRRTAASGMARLGIQLPIIEKVLNYRSGSFSGIVGVYQRHDFADEKRKALETWARFVMSLLDDKPAANSSSSEPDKSAKPFSTMPLLCCKLTMRGKSARDVAELEQLASELAKGNDAADRLKFLTDELDNIEKAADRLAEMLGTYDRNIEVIFPITLGSDACPPATGR